jgi:hypothetical protein
MKCRNCNAIRFGIKQRGLCKRCYKATLLIEKLEGWNPNDERTLRGYPRSVPLFPPPIIARMKKNALSELRARLQQYKLQEKWREEPTSSISIEYQLRWLAKQAGARKPDFLHGVANCFDDYTPEQRKTLYNMLKNIQEYLPEPPIPWSIL